MEFVHHFKRIIKMFENVIRLDHVECFRREGIWKHIQVVDDIRLRTRIGVKIQIAGLLERAATDIEFSLMFNHRPGLHAFVCGGYGGLIGSRPLEIDNLKNQIPRIEWRVDSFAVAFKLNPEPARRHFYRL
jgi:hypothetical protein